MLEENAALRVLVVAAHPDDIDFGCAGTVATWTQAGTQVAYCIVTDGAAGGFDPDESRSSMAAIRQAEQRAAAGLLGVSDITFLGYPDGELYVTHELRRDLTRVLRTYRPDRVVLQSPERDYERIQVSHPDHLAAGEAALCAVYPDASNPFAHPELLADEGLEAHTVREVWIMDSDRPNTFVDVTDTFDRKMQALQAHESQVSSIPNLEGTLRDWLLTQAKSGGLSEKRLAESFLVVETA